MSTIRLSPVIFLFVLFFSSCQKEETPVELPPKGDAITTVVDLGSDYRDQIFYSFEDQKIVMTSEMASWDLSFEAAPDGYHVFMNGGKEGCLYNTHAKDMQAVTVPPKIKPEEWSLDAACGLPDSTALGDWMDGNKISKGEVYILKYNATLFPDTFKKIKLINVSADAYTIQYGDLRSTEVKTISIPKKSGFNFSYFAFAGGGQVVNPEPPKDTWDIVFTRYRYIYHELENFPYTVTGTLLNPYKTLAYEDPKPFDQIDEASIKEDQFTNLRDVIGFDWKSYSIDKGKYTVDPKKNFVIKTSANQVWKLHFLGYESSTGLPGSPNFEFKRLR